MTTITSTRHAKCKDCKFCERIKISNLTRHKCGNLESKRHSELVALNDLVCTNWKIS